MFTVAWDYFQPHSSFLASGEGELWNKLPQNTERSECSWNSAAIGPLSTNMHSTNTGWPCLSAGSHLCTAIGWLPIKAAACLLEGLPVGWGTAPGALTGREVTLSGWSSVREVWRERRSVPKVDWWADGGQKSWCFSLQSRWTASPSRSLQTKERTDRLLL